MTTMLYFQLPVGLTDEMIWPNYPVNALAALNAGLADGLQLEPEEGGGAITRFIGYKMLGNPRATRAEAAAKLPLKPGDTSPFFDPVDDIRRSNGTILDRTFNSPTDMATCGPCDRKDWMTIDRIVLLSLAGGRAYWIRPEQAMPVFFPLTEEQLADEVPAEFPERTYTTNGPVGQDGQPTQIAHVHTWDTWGQWQGMHAPVKIADMWYRSSSYGQSGLNVEIDAWVSYAKAGGAVLTLDDYLVIANQNTPPRP